MSSILIAIALAMDSFSVSVSGGASMKKVMIKDAIIVGLYFGLFQAGMTLLGWKAGACFSTFIDGFDHWVAFGLLVFIGGKMICEYCKEEDSSVFSMKHKILVMLAIATSIDALGVGLSYALLDYPIVRASIVIGITAFLFSYFGIYLGKKLKEILKNRAELVGGIILIIIAINIIIKHGVFEGVV